MAVGVDGALGTVLGVKGSDAVDGTLLPARFVATTVHVYAVPFVRPVTVMGEDEPDAG